jgi:hypothetical protein
MSSQICQWCDNEIVWDPEIGPEEFCPHCFNELGKNYRTINVGPDDEFGEENGFEYASYEDAMDNVRALQTSSPECVTCGELMVEAGEEVFGQGSGYRPIATLAGEPLLKAPFTLITYVCPSCFEVKRSLSETDREKWKLRANTKE